MLMMKMVMLMLRIRLMLMHNLSAKDDVDVCVIAEEGVEFRAWWFELFSKKSSERFGHQDSHVIYRYEHFLLSMILSTRSP